MNEIYERREDESEGWYDRFRLWRYMGSRFSLVEVYDYATKLTESMTGSMTGGLSEGEVPSDFASWQKAAQEFGWQARLRAAEEEWAEINFASDLEADQLQMVTTLLQHVNSALRRADLFALTRDEARAILPTLRLFFRDLFRLHLDLLQVLAGDETGGVAFSADEWMEAIAKVGGVQQLLADIRRVTDPAVSEAAWQPLRDILAQLYDDDASARRISDQAHLDGSRIHFAARALDRWHAILTEANHAGHIEELIGVALGEYPHNAELTAAVTRYRRALASRVDAEAKKRARKPGARGTPRARAKAGAPSRPKPPVNAKPQKEARTDK